MPETIIRTKRCPCCGEIKPRTDFNGCIFISGYCRVCNARKQRERFEAKCAPIEIINGEEWRDVIGYEDVYKISSLGRIQRLKGYKCAGDRILTPRVSLGYLTISLSKNGIIKQARIDQLVATAFIGPCPRGMEVNHLDHNRSNPRADNLEYCTHQKNLEYAVEQGRLHTKPRIRLDRTDVSEIKAMLRNGASIPKVAQRFGTSFGAITNIKYGHNWKHVK